MIRQRAARDPAFASALQRDIAAAQASNEALPETPARRASESAGTQPAATVAAADTLPAAIAEAAACRVCAEFLPLGPRPTFRVSETARILITGQAPGTKVHATGIPWNDPSGDRLRGWLAIDRDIFYDESRIALVGTGLCYPGRLPQGGDVPPRPECAPLWLDRFTRLMPQIRLTLLVGSYALRHHFGPGAMTDRVRRFAELDPAVVPLPHPSWRTTAWERRNPWFAAELLPVLRAAVRDALGA